MTLDPPEASWGAAHRLGDRGKPKAPEPDGGAAQDGLMHPLRMRIRDRIAQQPGILAQELAEQLGCNRSTLRHHLTKLQEAGIVQVVARKQRAHVFLSSVTPDNQGALSVLQRGRTWELALEVLNAPGRAQCDLTRRLGMSRKILRKYANRLLGEDLIREVETPPFLTYYPTRHLISLAEAGHAASKRLLPLADAGHGGAEDTGAKAPAKK